MASTKADEIILEINSQVNAEQLAYLLDYHPGKVQVAPAQVKCFCPLHNEQAFRSLILDTKAHTFRCTMKRCAGFEGGTFVDLWSKFTRQPHLQAALDLAENLKLPMDVASLRLLGTDLVGKAREAAASGDLAAARTLIDQAVAFDPEGIEPGRLSADIHLRMGDKDRAYEEYLRIIDIAIETKDRPTAQALLSPLLHVEPRSVTFAIRRLALAKLGEDPAEIIEAQLNLAVLYGETGSVSSELQTLDDLASQSESDAATLERIAEIHSKANRPGKMMEILERLAPIYEVTADWPKLIGSYERRLAHAPDDLAAGEELAHVFLKTGDAKRASESFLSLADAHKTQGAPLKAQALLRQVIQSDPDNRTALERLAALAGESGHRKEAVAAYRSLANLAKAVGKQAEAARYLGRARAIDPDDFALRRDLAEAQLSQNNLDEAIAELFGLADVFLTQSDPAEGFAVLDRIAELVPKDVRRQIEIGRCLEAAGYDDRALETYQRFIRTLQTAQLHDDILAVCNEARRLAPRNESFLDAAVDAFIATGRKQDAVSALREAAKAFQDVDNFNPAEQLLLRALKIDRASVTLKSDLAALLQRSGKNEEAIKLWIEVALTHRAADSPNLALTAAQNVLSLDPNNIEAKAMLAEALEATGQIPEALDLWKSSITTLLARNPASPQALRISEHALDLSPGDLDLLKTAASLKFAVHGPQAARSSYENWIARAKSSASTEPPLLALSSAVGAYDSDLPWRSDLAELLLAAGDENAALPHFEALLAGYRSTDAPISEARRILERLVALKPNRLDLRLDWAETIAQAGDITQAHEAFNELAQIHLAADDQPAALRVLQASLNHQPENRDLLLRVAELLDRLGNKPDAIAAFERLLNLSRKFDTWRGSVAAIERLLLLSPDRMDLRLELAKSYEAHGEIENASDQYLRLADRASKEDPASGETLALAQKLADLASPNDKKPRELLLHAYLARGDSKNARALLEQMGDIALREGDLDRAETLFKRIQEIDPQYIGSGERLGKLYEARGQVDQAADAFRQVLGLYEKKEDARGVICVLGDLKRLAPKDADLRLRLARTLAGTPAREDESAAEWYDFIGFSIAQSNLAAAQSALDEARTLLENRWDFRFKIIQLFATVQDDATTLSAWREFCEEALASEQYRIAREAATEALSRSPDDVLLMELRVQADLRLGELEEAEGGLRNLAQIFTVAGDHATAEGFLRRAIAIRDDAPDLLGLLADSLIEQNKRIDAANTLRKLANLHEAQDDTENAILRAREIVELCPEDVEAKDFLSSFLLSANLTDEAMTLWREIAEGLTAGNERVKAMERYEDILAHDPGDVDALRHLGDLTLATGGADRALPVYERLISVMTEECAGYEVAGEFGRILGAMPEQLSFAERYAVYLHSTGETERARKEFLRVATAYEETQSNAGEALRVIKELAQLLPMDLDVQDAQALLLTKLGRKDEAVKTLRRIAEARRGNNENDLAATSIALVADILKSDESAQLEAATAFESLKAADQAIPLFLRAVELAEKRKKPAECIPLLQRAIALAPDDLSLAEHLARTFERAKRSSDALKEWLDVASRYEDQEDPARALEICKNLKSSHKNEPEPRRRIARLLLNQADLPGALSELRDLVEFLISQKEIEEAIATLRLILNHEATDLNSLKLLAELYRSTARLDALFEALLGLEKLYSESDDLTAAAATLEELRSLRPHDLQLARQSFDLLVKMNRIPDAQSAGRRLAETLLAQDEAGAAADLLRQITQTDPNNPELRVSLALMAKAQGHPELALSEFRRGSEELRDSASNAAALRVCEEGLKIFPDDAALRRARIAACKLEGRADEAIEEQIALASLHESRGEANEAYAALDEILAEHPENVATHQAFVMLAMGRGDHERMGDHLIQLAEIHYGAGHIPQSIEALQQLLELQPERTELRIRLAELFQEAGDSARGREVWFQAAVELRRAGALKQAIEVYTRVLENHPRDLETLGLLTECHRDAGDDDAYMTDALQLSEIHMEKGSLNKASELLEGLSQRFPRSIPIWERLSSLCIRTDDPEGAVRCYMALFELHQASKRYDLAKAALDRALQARPTDVGILQQLGEICLRLNLKSEGLGHLDGAARLFKECGRFEDARQIVERMMKLEPTNVEARRSLGSLCEAMGDRGGAVRNYSLAARDWTERRNHGQAIEAFERLLELDGNLSEEREMYAHVLEREGRIEEACNQYLKLIQQLKENADPRQVIRYCRQILKLNSNHVGAHEHLFGVYETTRKPRLLLEEAQWLADYYISVGEMDHAENYIRRGLEQSAGEIELRKRFVEILIETGRGEEAATNLQELSGSAVSQGDVRTARWALMRACEVTPGNLEYRSRLGQLLESAGELGEARKVRLEIVKLLLLQGEMEKARAMGERVVESAPNDEELRGAVAGIFEAAGLPEVAAFHYTYLARGALELENHGRAIELAEHIIKIKPRHIPARECLVSALNSSGDTTQACVHARELYNLYLDAADYDAAQRALKMLIQYHPSDPEPRQLMVELYRKLGRADLVIEQLRRLAEILANAGQVERAVAALKELIQIRPDDTRARARYIDLYSQLGDESELYEDYLHLARAFRKKGSVVEASQVYEKLMQMQPGRPECREQFVEFLFEQSQVSRGVEESRALVGLYLNQDMKVEAGRTLERALSKSPQDTQMRHQLATLQIRTNRRGLALETLRGLLKEYEQSNREQEQVHVIQQTLEIDPLNVELRQRLAELLLKLSQPEQAREQRLALAKQYLDRQLFDLAEREYLRILDIDPTDVEIWQKKIQTHLQIGTENEVVPDMNVLAGILVEKGRLRDAVELYRRIRHLEPDNIDALRKYIEAYVQIGVEEELVDDYIQLANLLSQTGEVDGALKVYLHLGELSPDNTMVRARLRENVPLATKGQTQDRQKVNLNLVAKAEAATAGPPAPASPVENSEPKLDKAIENYENILNLNPENPAVRSKLAELIAKSGRMKEADEQWAQAANDFLTKGDFTRSIQILEELVGRHPDDARLRERLSRAILKRESLNAIGSIVEMPTTGIRTR